ncbi:MAG: spermidine synthase [Actinomycetota bacterium]|nr:spermidine synthase [Actinomycetota bacterium]
MDGFTVTVNSVSSGWLSSLGLRRPHATLLPAAEPADAPRQHRIVVGRLLLGSATMLFLELALIRWLGANVVHLSYFSNFVLLGSFLGVGLGFLISRKRWSALPFTAPLLAVTVVLALRFPVTIQRAGADVIYFTGLQTTGPPAWVALPVVFLLVAATLAGPAEVVGRCFGHLEPLTAYRYDLVGSLIGIGLFTGLSFLWAPSVVWGILAGCALVVLATGTGARLVAVVSALVIVFMLLGETLTAGVSWSPYYKITTHPSSFGPGALSIWANGVPHQTMAKASWRLEHTSHQYGTPYKRLPHVQLDNVLVVGAGSGSDVAIALRKGAKHVDAVEIDPRILQLGERFNPDHVYQDPRVSTHVNDGRAFLERTDTKYDLILFALPDSLALVNGASQIRLESFLFTEEALRSAADHLKPDGGFAMYNYYREDWLIDRLAGTASTAFGHPPCVDGFAAHQAVVTIAKQAGNQQCGSAYAPTTKVVAPATDDAPFLYYRGGSIPPIYLWTLGGILLLSLLLVRVVGGRLRAMRPYGDLFFMGAAFLLLETKNVATFALLFGTTWLVNAMVFAGVLLTVLAAVEATRRLRTPPIKVVYAGVLAALVLAWVVRPGWLLALPFLPRLVAATALAFLPIFLANVAFAKRFASTSDSQEAFGVNLLGAIVGGCLEYVALLTGYADVLVVVALIYLVAFLLLPRTTASGGSAGVIAG